MKETIFDLMLRKMRLNKVLPHLKEFENPRVLDVGCGWEARLLKEIEPFIAKGVGIDFKAPKINTEKLCIFEHYFEPKPEFAVSNERERERERERAKAARKSCEFAL